MMAKKKRGTDTRISASDSEDAQRSALSERMTLIAEQVDHMLPDKTDFMIVIYPFGVHNPVSGFISSSSDVAAVIGALRIQTQRLQESLLASADFVGTA